jgi:hypothetical protein
MFAMQNEKSRLLCRDFYLLNLFAHWSTKRLPALTKKIKAKIKVTVCLVDCHSASEYKNAPRNKKYFFALFMMAKEFDLEFGDLKIR